MLTLAQNNVEIMRLLLEHGADPTLEGDGDTPLQLACGEGVCAVVRLLLDHGVDPDENASRRVVDADVCRSSL